MLTKLHHKYINKADLIALQLNDLPPDQVLSFITQIQAQDPLMYYLVEAQLYNVKTFRLQY